MHTATTPGEDSSLRLQFLLKDLLEGDRVSSELDDTLMKLVKCHLVRKLCPAEFRLIVDVGHLWQRVGFSGGGGIELFLEPGHLNF